MGVAGAPSDDCPALGPGVPSVARTARNAVTATRVTTMARAMMRSRSRAGAGTGRSAPRRWPRDHRTLPPARSVDDAAWPETDVDRRL